VADVQPPQQLDQLARVITVPAKDRDIEHGHLQFGWVTASLLAVLAQHRQLVLKDMLGGRQIAAIGEPGGDVQRPPLT
jgi:hypothetical protein